MAATIVRLRASQSVTGQPGTDSPSSAADRRILRVRRAVVGWPEVNNMCAVWWLGRGGREHAGGHRTGLSG
jgi:hypothetical protein